MRVGENPEVHYMRRALRFNGKIVEVFAITALSDDQALLAWQDLHRPDDFARALN